jgi:hypothetical protein
MTENNVLREFDTLPPEAQRQVRDFIAFLQTRYMTTNLKKSKSGKPISNDPFIGIWRNREDMQDSNTWVRTTRNSEWR